MSSGADHAHTSESHGGARAIGWDLLDALVIACACLTVSILAEFLFRAYREQLGAEQGVRADLTPPAPTEPAGAEPA